MEENSDGRYEGEKIYTQKKETLRVATSQQIEQTTPQPRVDNSAANPNLENFPRVITFPIAAWRAFKTTLAEKYSEMSILESCLHAAAGIRAAIGKLCFTNV
tara:strand:+ start:327 stop:632 length:306 start_codon:yes stop_codon:yes gene_type:complete